jgi:hypothetical protein
MCGVHNTSCAATHSASHILLPTCTHTRTTLEWTHRQSARGATTTHTDHAACLARAVDAGSDDECDEREQAEVAKIRANARLVSQCGQTLQPGAWRGCCKSPW